MSAQQPRAYNYVATQDFSANSSAGEGGPNSAAPPNQYQLDQQQHYDPSNDAYRPPPTQQHYYPVSETPQQPSQGYLNAPPPVNAQSHPNPPPVNAQSHPVAGGPAVNHQSHPAAPPLNYQSHPPTNEYKSPPAPPQQQTPYGDPGQQWGQMAFNEKFKPPSNKPKWNDVLTRILKDAEVSYGLQFFSLPFSLLLR